MGRFLIGERNRIATVEIAACFTFHQHRKPAGGDVEFGLLFGDDIRQLVHGTAEVRDLFFEVQNVGHCAALTHHHACANTRSRCPERMGALNGA